MFSLSLISRRLLLATITIVVIISIGPSATLAKKVKGKGTVEILAAGKAVPAKKKASTPTEQGPSALTGECKAKFEEYKEWGEYYKTFALGVSGNRMACAFSEGDSSAVDKCNENLKTSGIYGTHCTPFARNDGGTIKIIGKITTKSAQSNKSASKPEAHITADVKKRALEKAKMSAWKSYIQKTFNESKRRSYNDLKPKFIGQLDTFFVDYVTLKGWTNKESGTYTILIRAEIDDVAVDAFFLEHSSAATQKSGSGSPFVIIFQARRATSMKSYDKRRTNIKAAEGTQSTKEIAAAKGGTVVSGTTNKSMSRTETGGSLVRRSSKIKYEIISAKYVGATMKEVLNPSGFETEPYRNFAGDCDAPHPKLVSKSYIDGDEIPFELWQEIKAAAVDCEIKFLAVGTLDVDAPNTDPSRGNIVVTTRALAEVFMLKKRGRRTSLRSVASVGPIQIKGWGDDDQIASTNSLRQAAKKVASDIRDTLNQKDLR